MHDPLHRPLVFRFLPHVGEHLAKMQILMHMRMHLNDLQTYACRRAPPIEFRIYSRSQTYSLARLQINLPTELKTKDVPCAAPPPSPR